MRCAPIALLFALAAALSAAAQTTPAPAPSQPKDKAVAPAAQRRPIYDEKADAREQIDAAVAAAARENRRVLIQWGGNWCIWCHLLHDTMAADKGLKKKLQYEYDVVLIDAVRDGKNMDLALEYGADLKKHGVPFLTVLDAAGKPLANQETASLEVSGKVEDGHDPVKIMSFLSRHQAPYRNAEEILSKGLADAAAANKKVFLHFGAPWCVWCHRLEKWMARPDVAGVLAKDFVDVKIDTDRTIGGDKALARFCPKPGGIPWFAFLSPSGEVLATSDAPGGNVGFPYQPGEIDHFIAMLDKVRSGMTEQEVQALRATLQERPAEENSGG